MRPGGFICKEFNKVRKKLGKPNLGLKRESGNRGMTSGG